MGQLGGPGGPHEQNDNIQNVNEAEDTRLLSDREDETVGKNPRAALVRVLPGLFIR